MTKPTGWNARTAISNLKAAPWKGHAWRFHGRRYDAIDSAGSRLVSGRYNRGSDQFPEAEVWAALYLALRAEVALGEIVRHIFPDLLPKLNDFRLSELDVELQIVLDCRDAPTLGLEHDDLVRDYDFEVTQELATEAVAGDAEGMLVPSATQLGDNLIVFPARLLANSRLVVVDTRDPRLYVQR